MTKFNMEKLKGLDLNSEKDPTARYKVGDGLLTGTSKRDYTDSKIVYLHRDEIEKNEKNEYSIEGIEGLAWSIAHAGLLQPLHVKKAEGKYILLGGERRLTAIDQLIADPEISKWTKDTLIPCIVKNPDTIDLPLPENLKESLSIITTNKESRNYTDADRMMEIREWKKVINVLRSQGVEKIPYVDSQTGDTELVIKGNATRDLLAKTTGMSRGAINKFEKVEMHGSDALKEAILSGKTSVHTASEMIDKLEEDEQEQMLKEAEKTGDSITLKDVRKKAESIRPDIMTADRFKKDIRDILKILKQKEIYLDEQEQMHYNNCIRDLKKLLYKES